MRDDKTTWMLTPFMKRTLPIDLCKWNRRPKEDDGQLSSVGREHRKVKGAGINEWIGFKVVHGSDGVPQVPGRTSPSRGSLGKWKPTQNQPYILSPPDKKEVKPIGVGV